MLLKWNKDVIKDNAEQIAREIYRPEQAGMKVWLTNSEAGDIPASVNTASTKPNPENWGPGELLILDVWTEPPHHNNNAGLRSDDSDAVLYIAEYIRNHTEEFTAKIYRREELDDCIYIYTPTDLWNVMDIFKNVLGADLAPVPAKVKSETYRVDLSVEPDTIEQILQALEAAGYHYDHMKV